MNLPWLVQAGLALVVFGGAGDVAYHSVSGLPHTLGHTLHVITLVGMVVTLVGVLLEAAS